MKLLDKLPEPGSVFKHKASYDHGKTIMDFTVSKILEHEVHLTYFQTSVARLQTWKGALSDLNRMFVLLKNPVRDKIETQLESILNILKIDGESKELLGDILVELEV